MGQFTTIHSNKGHVQATGTAANRQNLLSAYRSGKFNNTSGSVFGNNLGPVCNTHGGSSKSSTANAILAGGVIATAGISLFGALSTISANNQAAKPLGNNTGNAGSSASAGDIKETASSLKKTADSCYDKEKLQAAYDQAKPTLASVEGEISAAQGQADTADGQIKAYQDQLQAVNDAIADISNNQIPETTKKYDGLIGDCDAKISEANQNEQSEVGALSTTSADYGTKRSEIHAKYEKIRTEQKAEKERLQGEKDAKLKELNGKLDKDKAQKSDLEGGIKDQQAKSTEAHNKVKTLTPKRDEIKGYMDKIQNRINTLSDSGSKGPSDGQPVT